MPSIAKCASKLGTQLNSDDVSRAQEISQSYVAKGWLKTEADQEALREIMREVRGQRADVVSQIEAAGGKAPTRGKAQTFVAGVTPAQEAAPTDIEMDVAERDLTSVLEGDETVTEFKALSTVGLYGGEEERAIDYEVITTEDFNPAPLIAKVAQVGQENNQFDVFVSRTLADDEDSPNARPGIEIYFNDETTKDDAQGIIAAMADEGVDGFTFITDPRSTLGNPGAEAEGFAGIRLQYIPEISMRWDEDLRAKLVGMDEEQLLNHMQEATDSMDQLAAQIYEKFDVKLSRSYQYETLVIGKENYDDYKLADPGREVAEAVQPVGIGSPLREGIAAAALRYGQEPVDVADGITAAEEPAVTAAAARDAARDQAFRDAAQFSVVPLRSKLGFYSNVDKVVLEMNLPGFNETKNNPTGAALGQDVWDKIRSSGIKKEEVEWMGLEEFLIAGDRFTREDVDSFVRSNGVKVEETIGIENSEEFDDEVEWDEEVVDGTEQIDERAAEESNYLFKHPDEDPWWFDQDEQKIWYAVNMNLLIDQIDSDKADKVQDIIDDPEISTDGIINRIKDLDIDYKKELIYEFQEEATERADNSMNEMYYQDPDYEYTTEQIPQLKIVGSNDSGYVVFDNGKYVDDIEQNASANEAQIAALEYAREKGYIKGEVEGEKAQWSDYVEGDYDNYREIKLRIPGVKGDFYKEAHFPDRNIVAFLRVTDRKLTTGGPIVVRGIPNDSDPADHNLITITTDEAIEHHKEGGTVYYGSPGETGYNITKVKSDLQENMFSKIFKRGILFKSTGEAVITKTFHIDEMQSDWHQSGREYGYKTEESTEDYRKAETERVRLAQLVSPIVDEVLVFTGKFNSAAEAMQEIRLDENWANRFNMHKHINQKQADLIEEWRTAAIRAIDTARVLDRGEADAPFKGDAWMVLALRRAVLESVQGDYDTISFADSETLQDRWSTSYSEMYDNQYDHKMPSLMKKITGVKPRHVGKNGEPLLDKIDLRPFQKRAIATELKLEQARIERSEIAEKIKEKDIDDDLMARHEELERQYQGILYDRDIALSELTDVENKNKVISHQSRAGMWLIDITPELRSRVQAQGLPLFRESLEKAGDGISIEEAEAAITDELNKIGDDVDLNIVVINNEQANVLAKKTEGTLLRGFVVRNNVFIVADNLIDANDAVLTFAHEVKGHFGINNIVGDNWHELMELYTGLKERGGKDFDKIHTEYTLRRGDAKHTLQTEVKEFIAITAEGRQEQGSIQSFMRKVREFFVNGLRRMGFGKFSMTDIDVLLSRSEAYVKGAIDSEAYVTREPLFSFDETPVTEPDPDPEPDPEFDMPAASWSDDMLRYWQDKFKPVLNTQHEIEKVTGEQIDEDQNTYRAEEAFYGKTENDLRILREDFIEPLAKGMAEYDIKRDILDQWLIASHAKERNNQIAKINPEMPDGGSGMTTKDAQEILAMAGTEEAAQLDELSEYVYGMLAHKRALMRSLQADSITDAWEAVYEYYVPLKGMANNEEATGNFNIGRGFDIRGKEGKRALGRASMAESPMLHAIRDVTEAQIRYRKNEVGNTFLKMVEENPNSNYWEIFTAENPDVDRGIIQRGGEDVVQQVVKNMLMDKDHYYATKRDGKTYFIKIQDQKLIRALQNMGPGPMDKWIRAAGSVTRFLSSMSTSYNPEFIVSNMSRDIQTAVINMMAEQDIPGGRAKNKRIARRMVKSVPVSMRAIYASLRGKTLEGTAGEWQKTFDQFRADGAKTGWFDMKDMDQQATELERMVNVARGGVSGNLQAFADNVISFIEDANSAVENAVRLSAYKHAIDAGVSRKQATSLAKNLTVNFNRKGEAGATMNSLYMFANASIQGTATFARAMGTLSEDAEARDLPIAGKRRLNAAQKVAVGLVFGSYLLALMNREGAGEDDDGISWWDKVPGHVRERNLILMKSIYGGEPGEYHSIPLPYGYNMFHVMGDTIEAATNSTYRGKEQLSIHMVTAILGAFAPLGFESSADAEKAFVKTFMPTIFKPAVHLGMNENFYGGRIFRENSPYGVQKPDSALSRKNTAEHWKLMSTFMNDVSGGSEFRSGWMDVSPDTLGYLFDFTLGGAGKFWSLTTGVAEKVAKGKAADIEAREIPFYRKVSGKVSEFNDLTVFYDRARELKQLLKEEDSLDGPDLSQFTRKYGDKLDLIKDMKSIEKELKDLRAEIRDIEVDDMPDDEKDAEIKEIQEEMDAAVDEFNNSYNLIQEPG